MIANSNDNIDDNRENQDDNSQNNNVKNVNEEDDKAIVNEALFKFFLMMRRLLLSCRQVQFLTTELLNKSSRGIRSVFKLLTYDST